MSPVGTHVSAGGGPEKRKLTDAVSSAKICQIGLIDLRVTELERAAHVLFPLLCPTPQSGAHESLVVDADPHVQPRTAARLKSRTSTHKSPHSGLANSCP